MGGAEIRLSAWSQRKWVKLYASERNLSRRPSSPIIGRKRFGSGAKIICINVSTDVSKYLKK